MPGALIIVVAMVLVGPFLLFAGGAVWSAMLGGALEADRRHAPPPGQGGESEAG